MKRLRAPVLVVLLSVVFPPAPFSPVKPGNLSSAMVITNKLRTGWTEDVALGKAPGQPLQESLPRVYKINDQNNDNGNAILLAPNDSRSSPR